MGLITKVLKVDGEKTVEREGLNQTFHLYPGGTRRIVKKYFLRTRNIEGTEVKGNWILEQEASIKRCESPADGGIIYYNDWKNIRAIEPYSSVAASKLIAGSD